MPTMCPALLKAQGIWILFSPPKHQILLSSDYQTIYFPPLAPASPDFSCNRTLFPRMNLTEMPMKSKGRTQTVRPLCSSSLSKYSLKHLGTRTSASGAWAFPSRLSFYSYSTLWAPGSSQCAGLDLTLSLRSHQP